MAYESMTYEYIIARMISRISADYPTIDIREGSMVFNAVASAAMECAILYTELDNSRNESFIKTASREYILKGCDQVGIDISIFNATPAFVKGVFNVPIEMYSRWNLGLHNYLVIEEMENDTEDGMYYYKMQCESIGSEPNVLTGDLTPIDFIDGNLTTSKITECLIEGEDETPDDEIVDYYVEYINHTASDGNIGQYKLWCQEFPGIGNYRIFPLWNGDNTVKVSILNSSNRSASEELIAEFQEYLDPGTTGMGDGIAPIGAFVTVSTATEQVVTVSAKVKFKDGYSDISAIDTALSNFFAEIAYEKSTVGYMNVGAKILDIEGVDFITDLALNGGTVDIPLGDEVIPILGTTNWTVV